MTETILIVEDDKLSMKLETDLLQAHGYNILQSVDGKNALHLARKHHQQRVLRKIL